MGLVTQRNQKLEKLFNDLAIDPKEKSQGKRPSQLTRQKPATKNKQ